MHGFVSVSTLACPFPSAPVRDVWEEKQEELDGGEGRWGGAGGAGCAARRGCIPLSWGNVL